MVLLLVQEHGPFGSGPWEQSSKPGSRAWQGPLAGCEVVGEEAWFPFRSKFLHSQRAGDPMTRWGWEWAPMIPVVTRSFGLKERDARRVPTRISNGGGNHRVEQDVPSLISEPLMPVPVRSGQVWGIIVVIKLPF